MNRRRAIICIALAALAVSAAEATGAGPALSGTGLASVRVAKCTRSKHTAIFYSRMHRVHGSVRMSMRFTVLERVGGGSFSPVAAPGLGRWRKSQTGVRVFGFRQRVRGLTDGSTYRARVDYRWLDADGHVVLRARRRSRGCVQYGPLPNLAIASVRVRAAARPGASVYVVRVANRGRATARDVPVALSVDGGLLGRQLIASVAPGEIARIAFLGPVCERADSPVVATADPDGVIHESSERDNRRIVSCAAARQ
jgi:hypothetical protein